MNFMGKTFKYLYGTLDADDLEDLNENINDIRKNMINNDEINEVINQINNELRYIYVRNTDAQTAIIAREQIRRLLEYIDDIQMAMQLARHGLLDPKLLNHETAIQINQDQLLHVETSVWLSSDKNLYIILQIPLQSIETPVYTVVPYPDMNENLIEHTLTTNIVSAYLHNENVIDFKTKTIITDECITSIIKKSENQCKLKQGQAPLIQYIYPNILITYKLIQTQIFTNCKAAPFSVTGNQIIQVNQCGIQINNVTITIKEIHPYKKT